MPFSHDAFKHFEMSVGIDEKVAEEEQEDDSRIVCGSEDLKARVAMDSFTRWAELSV